jgi:hypothetical protein
MITPFTALSYTVFKKGLIKFMGKIFVVFEALLEIVGWICLIVFACYVYVVGKVSRSHS